MMRLQEILRHQRAITIGALVILTLLAWVWIIAGAGMSMDTMPMPSSPGDMGMPDAADGDAAWSIGWFALALAMWWVMMIAMMIPAAAPTILLYARSVGATRGTTRPATGAFVSGYLLAWGGFSLAATTLQMMLEGSGILGRMTMASESNALSGAIFLAAGVYQLSPLKQSCLRHCRDPARFLMHQFRPGPVGAMRMGILHGSYCVGCCWLLMALLFVGGVMNLAWIALLTVFVAAEKLLRHGRRIAIGAGLIFIGCGIALIAM